MSEKKLKETEDAIAEENRLLAEEWQMIDGEDGDEDGDEEREE